MLKGVDVRDETENSKQKTENRKQKTQNKQKTHPPRSRLPVQTQWQHAHASPSPEKPMDPKITKNTLIG